MKKHSKKLLLVLLCLPLLLTGCKQIPTLQDGKQIVLEVNGKQFTAEELFDALKEQGGTSVAISMVDKYITEQELTDEMKKEAKASAQSEYDTYKAYYASNWSSFLSYNGFKDDAALLSSLESGYQQKLVLQKYIKAEVIKDEDIQKYYDESIFGEITARHILIKPDVKDSMTDAEKKTAKEAALKEAKELIEQLKNSEKLEEDFIALAKEKSDDTGSKSEGGLIENFTNDSGLVKEFWEGSLKLEVGKMTLEPVESEYGYHIIYKVSQKDKPSLEDVKSKVIDKVCEELLSADNASYVYMSALREKYGMQIHDDIIKSNYDLSLKNLKK